MKILLTTDAYDSMINGVAVSVHNLYDVLKKEGHDVRILTLSSSNRSYFENDIYYIRSKTIQIYPDARATLAFRDSILFDLLQWKPEIIHSQCEFFTFVFAKKIANHLQIPMVHTYHTLYEYYTHYFCPNKKLGTHMVSSFSRKICNQVDTVIAPTSKTASILQRYGVTSPIEIIPTGISLENLQQRPSPLEVASLKAQLHIPADATILLALGRLAKEKHIDFLIQQMKFLASLHNEIHLLIVGDGPARKELTALVQEWNLENNIHFSGMVPPNEVYKYYHLGDVFVSASSSETQGLTYIEALACGLPLLCRKDPCLDGVLTDGWNGYFFYDQEDFAQKLTQLLYDLDHHVPLQARALLTATECSKECFGGRVLHLYNKILEQQEEVPCTRFKCIPKLTWRRGMGY